MVDPATLGELGDVDQPLHARRELDERAETLKACHGPARGPTDDEVAREQREGVVLERFGRERDLRALRVADVVDADDAHPHLVADAHHLARVIEPRPRHLRDVEQAIDAADVDERAEVRDAGHDAVELRVDAEQRERVSSALLALLPLQRSAGDDDVSAVLFDPLHQEVIAVADVEVGLVAGALKRDLREGAEGAATHHLDLEAALVGAHDLAFDGQGGCRARPRGARRRRPRSRARWPA